MLNAFNDLLCSILCWHNRLVPTGIYIQTSTVSYDTWSTKRVPPYRKSSYKVLRQRVPWETLLVGISGFYFSFFTFFGSMFLLLGIIILYIKVGATDYMHIYNYKINNF